MTKHPKCTENKPHAKPHQTGTEHNKCNVPSSIVVRGDIETHIPPDLANKRAAAEEQKESRDKKRFVVEVVGLAFVIIYAGLTALQAFWTWKSAKATNDSVTTLKNQFALDQRPYVALSDMAFAREKNGDPDPPSKGKPIIVNIFFKNIGKSPAYKESTIRFVYFGPDAEKRLLASRSDAHHPQGQVLPPLGKDSITTAFSIKDQERNQTTEIRESEIVNWDGTLPIIVYGNFFYEDIFGTRYCTEFAERWLAHGFWVDISGHNPSSCKDYEGGN